MAQRLHLVFGGELTDPTRTEFRDTGNIHIVGIFPDYASAYSAWKAEARRTVSTNSRSSGVRVAARGS